MNAQGVVREIVDDKPLAADRLARCAPAVG